MNKEKNFISAVVYVRNDEENIVAFTKQLSNILDSKFLNYEIIFVNDGSTDNTVDEIKKYAKNMDNASVSVINMSFYQGKEAAMNAGIDLAIGDFVYQFESVFVDYDMDLVFKIYEESLKGYDIVNAVPDRRKKLTSKLFYKVFNKQANFMYKLDTETFQIISRRAINRIYALNKTVPYRKAVQANCGLKMSSINYKPISNDTLKMDHNIKKEREKTAIDSLILFTDISYKITLTLSLIMIAFVIFTGIYTVVIFLSKEPVEGWTTTMLLLSIGFLGIFLIFTMIIKYLSIILNLVFKKTNSLIESIEKIN